MTDPACANEVFRLIITFWRFNYHPVCKPLSVRVLQTEVLREVGGSSSARGCSPSSAPIKLLLAASRWPESRLGAVWIKRKLMKHGKPAGHSTDKRSRDVDSPSRLKLLKRGPEVKDRLRLSEDALNGTFALLIGC